MPFPTETLLSLWAQALAAEVGIAISTEARRALANELYEARKGFPEYKAVSIFMPPDEGELWLVRKDADKEPEPIVEDSFEEL